jgi:hypothetical protein
LPCYAEFIFSVLREQQRNWNYEKLKIRKKCFGHGSRTGPHKSEIRLLTHWHIWSYNFRFFIWSYVSVSKESYLTLMRASSTPVAETLFSDFQFFIIDFNFFSFFVVPKTLKINFKKFLQLWIICSIIKNFLYSEIKKKIRIIFRKQN